MNNTGANSHADIAAQEKPESLENTIGLYWLHKLGIVSLVFGVVFLIMCTFQYFGSVQKLLAGLVAAMVLLFLGRRLENSENRSWLQSNV